MKCDGRLYLAADELGVPLALPLTPASFAPAIVSEESPIQGVVVVGGAELGGGEVF